MKVVIINPTYNEKGNVEKLITVLEEEIFPHIKNHDIHILVADDNSPDGTGDVVKDLMKKYKNLYLITGEKRGLGAAYVRAMGYAIEKLSADIMFEMDADFFHDPKKVPEFLQKIDEGYDFVIGTRYSGGGSIPSNWGIHRKIFSIFGNFLVRTILMRFWIHDWTGGFRALRKEVFLKEKEELTMFRGYTFQVAFLHKVVRDGFKLAEVPFAAKDRVLGRSKIAPAEYIVDLLKYVIIARFFEILHSPFPKYVVTGFIGYLINRFALSYFFNVHGLEPGLAGAIGAEFAIIWNFTVNNFWAFRQQKIMELKRIPIKFAEFNLVSFGSVIIIGSVITIGTWIFGKTEFVSQVFLVVALAFFVIPYSYSMYNIFIWKRWRPSFLHKIQELVG